MLDSVTEVISVTKSLFNKNRFEMIRVNRHIVAGALLAGAVLMSVAPAQAQAPLELTQAQAPLELEPAQAPVEPQAIGNSGIASGSADPNWFCGTIWRTCWTPTGRS
ncbi:hypothetical protein [Nocardia sp. NPDC004604]|uniref:hypothetical protein n=1 Tax=Nocardia sp. NPDC004604 TaxID=3157013 RepID=UPI0033AC9556